MTWIWEMLSEYRQHESKIDDSNILEILNSGFEVLYRSLDMTNSPGSAQDVEDSESGDVNVLRINRALERVNLRHPKQFY
jgi:hypothetical protein